MGFVNIWAALLGVAAVGLPLLVHWLTRPRPRRWPISTIKFLQEVIHQRRAIHRLRNIIILALRCLAVLLIGWAFARPSIGERPLIADDNSGAAIRVLVLDVSQSMAANPGNSALFERARALAAEHLQQRAGLRANLILSGARAEAVFEQASPNFAALREALSLAASKPERIDVAGALARAAESFRQSSSDAVRHELVVISDFQKTNWAGADFSVLPADTVIQLESVANPETPANLAILSIRAPGRVEREQEVSLEVKVGNYSAAAREAQVEVIVGDELYRLAGRVEPGGTANLFADIAPHGQGWQRGQARLVGVEDALKADDQRAFVIDVRSTPTYALITRQSAELRPSSSYYLERALMLLAGSSDRAKTRVVRMDPDQIEQETLASADLIAIDHVGKFSGENINLLTALLRRGRPVLYVAAEPIDATNLQRVVESAGQALHMPVSFLPPPLGRDRENASLKDVRRDQPPFSIFGDHFDSAVSSLRFSGGLLSKPQDGGVAEDLLASFDDGSAALMIAHCGTGRLAVFNVNLSASNLPVSPAFVPLIGELVNRLMGQEHRDAEHVSGEPLNVYLGQEAGGASGLTVVGPEASGIQNSELVDEEGSVLWRWRAGQPGVYEVRRGDETVHALATALSREESNLQSIPTGEFKPRLASGQRVHYHSAQEDQTDSDRAWVWFALACVGCVLVEITALKLFRK